MEECACRPSNNPNTDECWNVNAKQSMKETVRYVVERRKPKVLHLEPSRGVGCKVQLSWPVQRQGGRDSVIADQVPSSSWSVPTAKPLLKVKSVKQILFNSFVMMCRVVEKVEDINQKAKAEQHMAYDAVNLVENLPHTERFEGVYRDDVTGNNLTKEDVNGG